MRKFAYECGADYPERLRGTLLRKHIATNCHKLKLTEQEVSELANFMGHKENIHKQYYRLPQKEADILNISKYLEAALGSNNSNSDIDIDSNDEDNISYNNSNISVNDINTDDDLANNNFDNDNRPGKKQQSLSFCNSYSYNSISCKKNNYFIQI